jgi:hypothetical protein
MNAARTQSNANIRINLHNKTVSTKTKRHSKREFHFDGVFSDQTNDYELYVTVLLPLVETVLYHRKDATLIAFGSPRTGALCAHDVGKSSTLGTHESFMKSRNMLSEALNYFYSKADDNSSAGRPL